MNQLLNKKSTTKTLDHEQAEQILNEIRSKMLEQFDHGSLFIEVNYRGGRVDRYTITKAVSKLVKRDTDN